MCYNANTMAWRPANSLITLRTQVNTLWPDRSRASDGLLGDAAHAATVSDHNPNAAGVVTAFDITHDPAHGADMQWLADRLTSDGDPRIKYVIWNKRLWMSGMWVNYSGLDPHQNHLHLSVSADPNLYDNNNQWDLTIKQEEYRMDEDAAKDLWRGLLHREPENDEVWRAWVGKTFNEAYQAFCSSDEWLGQNHILKVAYPDALQQVNVLKAQIASTPTNVTITHAVQDAAKAAPVATKSKWYMKLLAAIGMKA